MALLARSSCSWVVRVQRGSTLAATDVRFAVIATNTPWRPFGATIAMFYAMRRLGKPDPGMMANGMLAGLVAITAPCAFVQPWPRP